MKKLLFMLLATMLAGAVLGGITGCTTKGSQDATVADCSLFVSTISGEETILLARSGLPYLEEFSEILADFKAEYGEENIQSSNRDPHRPHPEAIPICYEITMTIDFSDASIMPSISNLIDFGFLAVRMTGDTAICKRYEWACSEKDAGRFIPYYENIFNMDKSKNYAWSGGTIVNSTIKNLGPYVENMPIEF